MGMFDYVKYEADCLKCGEPLSGFQTKDSECQLTTLTPEALTEFENPARFYTGCDKCKTWHEFEVRKNEPFTVTCTPVEAGKQ